MDVATIGDRCGGLLEKVGRGDAGHSDCHCPGYWAGGDGSDCRSGKGGRKDVGCGHGKDRERRTVVKLIRRGRWWGWLWVPGTLYTDLTTREGGGLSGGGGRGLRGAQGGLFLLVQLVRRRHARLRCLQGKRVLRTRSIATAAISAAFALPPGFLSTTSRLYCCGGQTGEERLMLPMLLMHSHGW